jgi:hypothetical protein
MSTAYPLALVSDDVKTAAAQAWEEVREFIERFPTPSRSAFAPFFPTEACAIPIRASLSEYSVSQLSLLFLTPALTSRITLGK